MPSGRRRAGSRRRIPCHVKRRPCRHRNDNRQHAFLNSRARVLRNTVKIGLASSGPNAPLPPEATKKENVGKLVQEKALPSNLLCRRAPKSGDSTPQRNIVGDGVMQFTAISSLHCS